MLATDSVVAVEAASVRVAVIGSHPIIHGIVRVACDAIDEAVVVAEASTVVDATAMLMAEQPDVLVVDIDMPVGDGAALLREIADGRFGPMPKTLVLSDRVDGPTALSVLRQGVSGYLSRGEGLRGITTALRRVIAGDRFIEADIEAAAITELGRFAKRTREGAATEGTMTARERVVLEQLADGHTIRQIGRRLGISPRTVETHVSNIYRKLNSRSRVQAVSRAAALGLIDM
jgi:DNA-binding NarL/FixJ family response regulator